MKIFNKISVALTIIVVIFWASMVGINSSYITCSDVLGTFGYAKIFLGSIGHFQIKVFQFLTILFSNCDSILTGILLQNIFVYENVNDNKNVAIHWNIIRKDDVAIHQALINSGLEEVNFLASNIFLYDCL